MLISDKLETVMGDNSWIRKMYDRARALQREKPQEKIYDLSIGNPVFEPPAIVGEALCRLLQSGKKGIHRYLPNQGLESTRAWVAQCYHARSKVPLSLEQVIMTGGAGGAVNIILNALLNPGDEVVIFLPYFVEYIHYVRNFAGVVKGVPTDANFRIDLTALAATLSPRTKAIIINSPNNPTGVVYSAEELHALADLLSSKSREYGHPIAVISDEPYTRITYDGVEVPAMFDFYPHTIVASSFSKDLALAGERIGYIIVSPQLEESTRMVKALVNSLRILGFVNAPAMLQYILPELGEAMVDIRPYQRNRDLLYTHLVALGFSCVKPEGAFYLFPHSLIADDVRFIEEALRLNLVLVPGRSFGSPGYFRISFCFETALIKETLPLFTALAKVYQAPGATAG